MYYISNSELHMTEHAHHEELVSSVGESFAPILGASNQAIYIYLDDTHKVCNEKFSELLGYSTPAEWAAITSPFPETFVSEESRGALVTAYRGAMENHVGSSTQVTWRTKNGATITTSVILVPIVHEGHLFALHFVSA